MLAFVALFAAGVDAQAAPAGAFTLIEGRVDVLRKNADSVAVVVQGDEVFVGDIVRTKSKSKAHITLKDESILNLAENSRMEIRRFSFSKGNQKRRDGMFHMFRGQLRSIVHHTDDETAFNFKVETPTAVAAVRGTDWYAIVSSDALSSFICKTGKVEIKSINPKITATVVIGANQFTKVSSGQAPTPARVVTPAVLNNIVEASVAEPPAADEAELVDPKAGVSGGGESADGTAGNADSGNSEPAASDGTTIDSTTTDSGTSTTTDSRTGSTGGTGAGKSRSPHSTARKINSSVNTNATSMGRAVGATQPATGTSTATPPITTTAPQTLTSPVTIQIVF